MISGSVARPRIISRGHCNVRAIRFLGPESYPARKAAGLRGFGIGFGYDPGGPEWKSEAGAASVWPVGPSDPGAGTTRYSCPAHTGNRREPWRHSVPVAVRRSAMTKCDVPVAGPTWTPAVRSHLRDRSAAPAARDAQPARAVRNRRSEPAASEDSPPARPARPGKRSKPKPPPPPQPAYPQPRQARPAHPDPSPSPPPVRPNEPVPTPPGFYQQAAPDPGRLALPPHAPPAANAQQGGPGVFRGLLIRMLGGNADPPPAAPNPYFMAMPPPGYPQPYPAQGNPPPAPAAGYWSPGSPQEPITPEPPAHRSPAAPVAAARPSSLEHSEDDRQDRTQAIGGVDIDRLKIPKQRYSIEILDSHAEWRNWGPIPANGLNIGRAKNSGDFPGLASMAVRHLRFGYDNGLLGGRGPGVVERSLRPTGRTDRAGRWDAVPDWQPGDRVPWTPSRSSRRRPCGPRTTRSSTAETWNRWPIWT